MKAKLFLILMLVFLLMGCNNNENGLGVGEGVKLTIKGASNSGVQNGRTALVETSGSASAEASGIVFNEVLLGVRKIEFEVVGDDDHSGSDDGDDDHGDNSGPGGGDRHDGSGDDGDHDGGEIEFEGAFVVDLLAGTSTPDFGVAKVVPGTYEEIEIKLSPILPDGNSVFVSFTAINSAGDSVQVELSTKRVIELEIEDDDGFQIDENVLNNILVLVDLNKLLSGIDLSMATADQNGVIKINDTSNPIILKSVLLNFKNSCNAGEDDDHDNDIDDD